MDVVQADSELILLKCGAFISFHNGVMVNYARELYIFKNNYWTFEGLEGINGKKYVVFNERSYTESFVFSTVLESSWWQMRERSQHKWPWKSILSSLECQFSYVPPAFSFAPTVQLLDSQTTEPFTLCLHVLNWK